MKKKLEKQRAVEYDEQGMKGEQEEKLIVKYLRLGDIHMSSILSVSTFTPPHRLRQETTMEFARELFSESYTDIERLLTVFSNGQIDERYFAVPIHWFEKKPLLAGTKRFVY